ncbi:MAG: putative ABC transporter permease [Erysipelotrichia bacterium]|nr:putative ABC transporter permease [Erysipelotrichia bacterium]
MNTLLAFAFLFALGSISGWIIEVFFRHWFSSSNPQHKWVNPGFCIGPYLPIYGFGLCALFILSYISEQYNMFSNWKSVILWFGLMTLVMTLIEYIAGLISLKVMHVKLWDYSDMWGNIQGIICPLFSLFWAILGAIYLFFIHPYITKALFWLKGNLAFSFFIGLFFGVFLIDVIYSSHLISIVKKFADENQVVVRLEKLKSDVIRFKEIRQEKAKFFFPLSSAHKSLSEYLNEVKDNVSELIHKN